MDVTKLKGKRALTQSIASRTTDPNFYAALEFLPNPDTVLRKLGVSQTVFDAIVSDAHVIGELRSIRAGLLRFEYRVQPGGDTPADARAAELCEQLLAQRPAPGLGWPDTLWMMFDAVFRGYAVHEVVWQRQDRVLMPERVVDRPQRRFVFSPSNDLRLLTRDSPMHGVELGAFKWLLSRHMASFTNPYGVALLSSCFWPYTFKHSGVKYFAKFCERYGIPWALGRYPEGTPKETQTAIVDALAQMVEDAVAAVPEGTGVELLEYKQSGAPIQERFINLCNREMSKALTSQTLATEIQGSGARALGQVHAERQAEGAEADRNMVASTMNELFAWITLLNVEGANAPTFEFFEEAQARKDWADVLEVARGYTDVPTAFAHERLQIPLPVDGEDVLPRRNAPVAQPAGGPRFAAPAVSGAEPPDEAALMAAIDSIADGTLQQQAEGLLDPILAFAAKAPEQLLGRLAERYPEMDDAALTEQLARVIFVAETWGRLHGRES